MSKSKAGVSKTARASLRTDSSHRIRVEHVLVVESYVKPNGYVGLRRFTEKREIAL